MSAEEACRLLERAGIEALSPIMTSALAATGLEELRQVLAALAREQQASAGDGVPFLPVDRAFSIVGHGPVVTGTLRGAAVSAGDTLELWPLRRPVRVRAVEVHTERVAAAAPGQRVALNLRDVDIAELKRGMALAAPDTLAISEWLTVFLRAVEGAPALKNGSRLRVMFGTHEMDVRLRLLDRDVLQAGESCLAQLHGVESIALPAGEHVILRLPSPPRTVAGGKVLEPGAKRERRNCAPVLSRLQDLRLTPAAMIAAEVERAAPAGTTLKRLSQLSALATPRIVALLATLPFVVTKSGQVLRKADMDRLLARIPPPEPEQDRARIQNEVALAARIAESLRCAGLTPPSPATIMSDVPSKRAVERLLREGVIVRARDRAKQKEILFHRDAIEAAQRRLAPLLERQPGMLVTEIGAVLGISRKYSMPLLDHLDTIRFTRRVNDRRIRA